MKANNNYFGIYNSANVYDVELRQEQREMLAECNDCPQAEVSEEWITESIEEWLEDEKCNLNKETGGYIIAFADLGFWDGRRRGCKMIGSNVADILRSYYGGDVCEWYADRYNVRARASHHDGTHFLCFRYCDSREQAERVFAKIVAGQIKTEADFMRSTKSLRPFVASVYGWRLYGRQAA